MINISELQKTYPFPSGFELSALREYFQYKILDVMWKRGFAGKLVFLGGTAIRICYEGKRFSEDLDFDNRGMSKEEFVAMAETVGNELEREGYKAGVKCSFKNAFRARIGIENVLYENKLSPLRNQKLMIQIDATPQNFDYEPDNFIMQKYGIFRTLSVVPKDIILSQKVAAVLGRKRAKGRDFHDIVYLRGMTDFNMDYLRAKLGINDKPELKKRLLSVTAGFDFDALATDVEPFLMDKEESEYVRRFREYIGQKL